jgi:hypothetical protein
MRQGVACTQYCTRLGARNWWVAHSHVVVENKNIFEGWEFRKGCFYLLSRIISQSCLIFRRSLYYVASDVNKPYRRILISESIKHSFCDNIDNVA